MSKFKKLFGGGGGGGGGGDDAGAQARADELARQARIRSGTDSIKSMFDSQFTDPYFEDRKTSYLNYATPQLNDQYAEAQKQLTFALDRTGTLDSSARAQKEGELRKMYDANRQGVADQALSYSTGARSNIEDAKANLISMLNATGDAEGAVNSAMTRAKALSAPDTYSPLGQMFASFTGGLGQQAAAEKAAALSNTYGGSTGVDLFGNKKKSVTTTA